MMTDFNGWLEFAGLENDRLKMTGVEQEQTKYSRRDNIADSAHFRETAKDAGAA